MPTSMISLFCIKCLISTYQPLGIENKLGIRDLSEKFFLIKKRKAGNQFAISLFDFQGHKWI